MAPELRPFDPEHPIYQPIPPSCAVASYSADCITNISTNFSTGFFILDVDANSPPVFTSSGSDPVWTLIDDGVASPAYPNVTVRAPDTLEAGGDVDAPLVILDQSGYAYGIPTEYRLFKAVVNLGAHTVTYRNIGIAPYQNDGRRYSGFRYEQTRPPGGTSDRALGQAEIMGSSTGSGCSYTVGMVRPHEMSAGRITHAIRVAAQYNRQTFVWPAIGSDADTNAANEVPMGSRIYLPDSFDMTPLYASVDANSTEVPTALQKAAAKTVLRAIQEFGLCVLDSIWDANLNTSIYMEGESASFDWVSILGARNEFGSYNHIGRAIRDALNANTKAGYNALKVADPAVFDGFASD